MSTPDLVSTDAAFFAALTTADAPALDGLLAEDFLIVDVQSGGVTGRADFLAFVSSGQVDFESIDVVADEAHVRQLADTVGVVVGHTRMRLRMPDGSPFTGDSRYTHVFRRDDARAPWQLVSAQGTAIAG